MFCLNFIFIIFLFNAQQLSGSNRAKNVTVELVENGPLKVKFKFYGNCTSFTMCYKSVLYDKNVPWKLSKRFRFDKFFRKISTNTNECGQNGRNIEFSIVNGTVFVGKNATFKFNKKYSSQINKTFSKFEFHLNPIFFGKTLAINKVKLETMNIGNEFFAHSSLGTFLVDYAGLWLLGADIAPKKGQNPTKLMINVPDKCSIIYKIPPKCHTFDMEAAENGIKRSARHINPLISGGHSMDIKRIPWTVYFAGGTEAQNKATKGGHYSTCTASLISAKFILLAAHCLEDVKEGNLIILGLNSSSRNIFKKTNYDGILVELERKNDSNVFIHPKYSPPYVYDLALIKLPEDAIEFTSKMQQICIHCGSAAKFKTGIGHIAGWGRLLDNDCYADKNAEIPMDLRGRTAHLIECPDSASNKFKSDLICMEGSTIQSGDSGSPLLANNGTHFVQVGVTSSSICNRKTNTSRYNIFSRLDGCWIENIAGVRCGK